VRIAASSAAAAVDECSEIENGSAAGAAAGTAVEWAAAHRCRPAQDVPFATPPADERPAAADATPGPSPHRIIGVGAGYPARSRSKRLRGYERARAPAACRRKRFDFAGGARRAARSENAYILCPYVSSFIPLGAY
jgi:hypothetical protein